MEIIQHIKIVHHTIFFKARMYLFISFMTSNPDQAGHQFEICHIMTFMTAYLLFYDIFYIFLVIFTREQDMCSIESNIFFKMVIIKRKLKKASNRRGHRF
jgi:hypothetical protein